MADDSLGLEFMLCGVKDPQTAMAEVRPAQMSGRILVVDDNPDTAARTAALLSRHFDRVEFQTSPLEATRLVRCAASGLDPYRVIVSDLFMPELSGPEFLRGLGDARPAVVINTASLMAPIALRLSSGPTAPIAVHHKRGLEADLISKVDAALKAPASFSPQFDSWLDEVAAAMPSLTPTVQQVHEFCERVANYVVSVGELLQQLKTREDFTSTAWYKRNGAFFENALERLRMAHFGSVYKDNPRQASAAMHDILYFLAATRAPLATEADLGSLSHDGDFCQLLGDWQELFEECLRETSMLRGNLEEALRPEFDFEAFLKSSPGGVSYIPMYYMNEDCRGKALVKDPQGVVRNFLSELLKVYKRVCDSAVGFPPALTASYVDCDRESRVGEEYKRALQRIGAASYCKLEWYDREARSLDEELVGLLPQLAELQRLRLVSFSSYQNTDCRRLVVFIKVGEEQEHAQRVGPEKPIPGPDGSQMRKLCEGRVPVWEGLGPDSNIVVIGKLPTTPSRYPKTIYYEQGGKLYLVTGQSHFTAASLLQGYFDSLSGQERGLPEMSTVNHLYQQVLRINQYDLRLTIDGVWADPLTRNASKVLCSLGINPENIVMNPGDFAPKPDLR